MKKVWMLAVVLVSCGGQVTIPAGDDESEDVGLIESGEMSAEGLALTAEQVSWPQTQQGQSGPVVVALQFLLREAKQTVTADGAFGPQTLTALQSFQRASGLTATSRVDVATWTKLIVTLRQGSENDAVRAAQFLLKNVHGANLSVTGLVGPTTLEAITTFQRSKCLTDDGVVGILTWNSLIAGTNHCGANAAAIRILAAHNEGRITLYDETFGRLDGADALNNIKDAAAGRKAKQSCHGTAPCSQVFLQTGMLNALDVLVNVKKYRVFVTSIAGASHSATSFHYSGRAVDIGEVNGLVIRGPSAVARQFVSDCRALGAIEAFGPDNDPQGHSDHLHCAF
jgi:peptidoglycan hydrolase-like protein with peptidoglycan-binding domain